MEAEASGDQVGAAAGERMIEPYYRDEAAGLLLYCGDMLDVIPHLGFEEYKPGTLVTLTDPPYNVGMDYGEAYDDRKAEDEYMNWTNDWLQLVPRPLVVTPGWVNLELWLTMIGWPDTFCPSVKPNQATLRGPGIFNAWEAVLIYGKTPAPMQHDAWVMPIGQQAEVAYRSPNGHLLKRAPLPKYLPFWLKLMGQVGKPRADDLLRSVRRLRHDADRGQAAGLPGHRHRASRGKLRADRRAPAAGRAAVGPERNWSRRQRELPTRAADARLGGNRWCRATASPPLMGRAVAVAGRSAEAAQDRHGRGRHGADLGRGAGVVLRIGRCATRATWCRAGSSACRPRSRTCG